MKKTKIIAVLLLLVLGLSLTASPLAEEAYGAEWLAQGQSYTFQEMMRIALEENELHLAWLQMAAQRFPAEPIFAQALAAEMERAQTMRQLFAAWGLAENPADPPRTPEIPSGLEQALKAMRSMEERAMLMYQRFLGEGNPPEEAKAWAYQWEHAFQQQLEACDRLAEKLNYQWAWQHGENEEDQELNQEQNNNHGEDGRNQQGNAYQGEGNQDQQDNNGIPDGTNQNGGNGKNGD